jgi:flagellar hook-associated protein 3 FlgL
MSGWASIYNTTQAMLRFQGQRIARLQEMVASGARVNRSSDAPTDAYRILEARSETGALDAYVQNLDHVLDMRNLTSSLLQSMTDALARVRMLASQAASGTYGRQSRQSIATEINAILEQMVATANTGFQGRSLFGGGQMDSIPYVARREDGRIVGVDYVGPAESQAAPVADGLRYAAGLIDTDVFRSASRRDPTFLGQTGAKAGDGTSTVCGDVWLTAVHTATTYQGASGVAPGDSSAARDTILGTHHTLTVDEPAGTIRLDDGPVMAFTGTETDLALKNSAGDVVYVNVQGVAAGFAGTVSIDAGGTLSIDDGASTVAIDGTASQAVTDSRTGRILYVNTADVARAGLEPVQVCGTYDLFGALISVRDAISNSRNLPDDQQAVRIDQAINALVEVTDGVTRGLTSNGSIIQALTSLKESLGSRKDFVKQQADATENADIVDVASDLARRQVLYEASLTSASRLLSLSLLNYL